MWWLTTSAALCLSAALGDAERDPLLRLLQRHGLARLELVALEEALERNMLDADRDQLLTRFSQAMAEVAEKTSDLHEVELLRERLDTACDKPGDQLAAQFGRLQLALHEADLIRLQLLRCMADGCRVAASADRPDAEVQLEAPLGKLLDEFEKERRDAERQLDRVSANEAPRAGQRLARAERACQELQLRMGWLLLSRAWQARQVGSDEVEVRAAASQSLPFFGRVLSVTDDCMDPAEASLDMRGEQWFAEAMLGVAMARSLSGSWTEAEPWVATLAVAPMAESIRSHCAAWAVLLALEAGAPASALAALVAAQPDAAACEAARLVVRHLLNGPSHVAPPESLGDESVRVLVTRCGWAALAEAASDITRLPDGFTRSCAQVALGLDTPASDPRATVRAARQALEARPAAMREMDPWLQLAAASALLRASGASPRAREEFAPEARQLAAAAKTCTDEQVAADAAAVELAAAVAVEGECEVVAALRNEFIQHHPDDERTDALRTESAELSGELTDAALADLIAVPLGSPEGPRARRAASRVLYERFLAAAGESRAVAAGILLGLAAPDPSAWPEGSVDVVVRRQLHAALDPAVVDVQRAAELMQLIRSQGPLTDRVVGGEIGLREVELAVALNRLDECLTAAASLPEGDAAREARELALSALWKWVSAGERLLLAADSAMIARQLILATVSVAAHSPTDCARRAAAAQILMSLGTTADPANAAEALKIIAACADEATASNATLRTAADAALAAGSSRVEEWLARLSSRLDPASADCCRARSELVAILSDSDPDAARRLLQQHQVFVPGWGPEPWGARLREQAAALGVREVGQ